MTLVHCLANNCTYDVRFILDFMIYKFFMFYEIDFIWQWYGLLYSKNNLINTTTAIQSVVDFSK